MSEPQRYATIFLTTMLLRRADGTILMVRCHAPKVIDAWWWLNRETDDLEELRPYLVGMFGGRR